MSGYLNIKVRTDKALTGKFVDGVLSDIAGTFKAAGLSGSIVDTITRKELKFKNEPKDK